MARLEKRSGNASKKVMDDSSCDLYTSKSLRAIQMKRSKNARKSKNEKGVCFSCSFWRMQYAKNRNTKTYKNLKRVDAMEENPNNWKICRTQSKTAIRKKTGLLFSVFFCD